jgi:hypothetical protein
MHLIMIKDRRQLLTYTWKEVGGCLSRVTKLEKGYKALLNQCPGIFYVIKAQQQNLKRVNT